MQQAQTAPRITNFFNRNKGPTCRVLAGCGKSRDFGKMVMKRARSGNPGLIKSTGYEGAKTDELGWKQHRPTFSAACSHVRVQGFGRNYLFPQWREGAGSEERTAGDRTRRRRLNKLSCADWLPHDRGFVSGCLALRTSIGPGTGS